MKMMEILVDFSSILIAILIKEGYDFSSSMQEAAAVFCLLESQKIIFDFYFG
jgi:hypothetical protein